MLSILTVVFGVFGSFLTTSKNSKKRFIGFISFLITNILFIVIGFKTNQYNLIVLNCIYCFTSYLGIKNNMEGVK